MTFARIELIGHLGQDPEIRYTGEGVAVAHLSVATDERPRRGDEQPESRTLWHRVEAWGPLATILEQHARKGHLVFLSGTLDYREWLGRDGVARREAVVKLSGTRAILRLLARPGAVPEALADAPSEPGGPHEA